MTDDPDMPPPSTRPGRTKDTIQHIGKRERFCREFVIDHNSTAAAMRAGYSTSSAGTMGSQLMARDDVKKRIAELERPIFRKLEVTAERVIQRAAQLAFNQDPDGREVRHFDQIEALKLLGKHLQLFTTRIELKVEVDIAARLAQLRAARQPTIDAECLPPQPPPKTNLLT